MSKKRRTPNNEGREDVKNLNPNPTADQQQNPENPGRLKEKAEALGSKVVNGAKAIGRTVWNNRGKICLIAGAAVAALINMTDTKHNSGSDDSSDESCPYEIEQTPDETMSDTEAAD